MFKVEFHPKNYSWYKFTFKFETLDEAQQFVKSAVNHFVCEEDSEDMVVKFTTTKDEEE